MTGQEPTVELLERMYAAAWTLTRPLDPHWYSLSEASREEIRREITPAQARALWLEALEGQRLVAEACAFNYEPE